MREKIIDIPVVKSSYIHPTTQVIQGPGFKRGDIIIGVKRETNQINFYLFYLLM
ncbi:delta endotoxin C-terminal domain-containing protein [Bacillus cereus]|uniref:delta endotoxin C-terminal domain-containing protein n=1 Tax=Bacillus cereus TaxID=1396 RepID=UPI00114525DC